MNKLQLHHLQTIYVYGTEQHPLPTEIFNDLKKLADNGDLCSEIATFLEDCIDIEIVAPTPESPEYGEIVFKKEIFATDAMFGLGIVPAMPNHWLEEEDLEPSELIAELVLGSAALHIRTEATQPILDFILKWREYYFNHEEDHNVKTFLKDNGQA